MIVVGAGHHLLRLPMVLIHLFVLIEIVVLGILRMTFRYGVMSLPLTQMKRGVVEYLQCAAKIKKLVVGGSRL